MEKREKRQMWRIPLTATLIVLGVQAIMYMSAGSLPSVTRINLFNEPSDIIFGLPLVFELPKPLPRFWDPLYILVISILFISAYMYLKQHAGERLRELWLQFIVGLIFCAAIGALTSQGFGVIDLAWKSALGLTIFWSRMYAEEFDFKKSLALSMGTGLGYFLGTSIQYGFVLGFIFGVFFALCVALIFLIVKILKVSLNFIGEKTLKWISGD